MNEFRYAQTKDTVSQMASNDQRSQVIEMRGPEIPTSAPSLLHISAFFPFKLATSWPHSMAAQFTDPAEK